MSEPSRGALERADELINKLQNENDDNPHPAPCLRDDLEDHRKWVRVRIAEALDEAADGRPLKVDENGPY